MNKGYVLDIIANREVNTALFKPKNDISSILMKKGFRKISYQFSGKKIGKIISVVKIIPKIRKMNGEYFIFQYPIGSNWAGKKIIKNVPLRIKKIAVIHDLDSLRLFKNDKSAQKKELDFLSHFDGIITHSPKMSSWLVEHGIKAHIKNIEVFDYLTNVDAKKHNFVDKVTFAGNLEKSSFLANISIDTPIELFGPNPEKEYPEGINYKGQFSSNDLAKHMSGAFGLIWDGNSSKECNDLYGEYTKYNLPYKTSLYITSGMPVIVWKDAAVANFVQKENIGFAISNLSEIDKIFSTLNDEEYRKLIKNVKNVSRRMRNGFYIKEAIDSMLNDFK